MDLKTNQSSSSVDKLLWLIVAILLAAGIVANFYFSAFAVTVRLIGWIFLAAIVLAIAVQTQFGKISWGFIKEARMEMRKVTWPKRQETVQTTLVVVAMVVVMALILWGIDSLLLWAIGSLTGSVG